MAIWKRNPVFWLMWLLPGGAVLASFATLAIALQSGDRALPDAYHWEGAALDRDFARARRAAELGIELWLEARAGTCTAILRGAPGDPSALNLLLTNGGDASLDRAVRLRRAEPGIYRAPCAALPAGHWRLALDDDTRAWSLRGAAPGDLAAVMLRARDVQDGS